MKHPRCTLTIHQKTLSCLLAVGLLILAAGHASAQNWQLVWADEFNGSIGPDWNFETGGGGWGNNEQEYYQPQNASIQNDMLVITARQESVGGENYTSARMTTQGHQSWNYGKITARIALPGFQGSWPGFWMLGDNIGYVGWPTCGEIDIMEQINTDQTVHGSTHWESGGQADWTSDVGTSISDFHEYSITWDSQYIKFYVDDYNYSQFYIGGNSGGTDAFNDNDFFVILNMAVGGFWPGFNINNGALPANMYVDYVRVFREVDGDLIPGVHTIICKQNGRTIDNGSSTNWGTGIVQWSNNGGSQQKWNFTQNSDGSWTIVSQYSGDALDDGNTTNTGAQIIQWGAYDPNNANQHWWIDKNADGSYEIMNVASGKVLDNSSSSSDGYKIVQWDWNGGPQQCWFLQ